MKISAVKIRGEMFKKGITQIELGQISGLGRSTISAVCTGKSCRDDTAHRIADALGVRLEEITEN